MFNNDRSENEKIFRRLQELEEKAAEAERALERERLRRAEIEGQNSKLLTEKSSIIDSIQTEKQAFQEYQQQIDKLAAQTNQLDNKLRVAQTRLTEEEMEKLELSKNRKELEKEALAIKKDYLRKLKHY